ncbi:transposase, partial [Zestomonas thermotolerans]|uniref:transposase n=1 Tax=Zestomonas thermotolerans TaxID=157784 RepID=UPI0023F2EC1A
EKGGPEEPVDHALGRSRGGLTTKIHMLCDVLADKGYDAEHLRQYCDRYRMQPVIPLRTMKRKPKPGLPRLFDRPKYRQRNIIERMFGWLKESRRIGTRYDKLARSFAAMVTLACTLRCLRQYFSFRT